MVQFYPWFKISFLLFQTHYHVIIIHYHTQKQKKRKFEPRIKLNHNIYGYIFYGLTRMPMRKNVNNDVTMNLPIACIQPPPPPSEKSGKGEAVHRILTWVIRYCVIPLQVPLLFVFTQHFHFENTLRLQTALPRTFVHEHCSSTFTQTLHWWMTWKFFEVLMTPGANDAAILGAEILPQWRRIH